MPRESKTKRRERAAEIVRLLAEDYPEATCALVHDGPAITSAGGALSFEPALYLTELLYGREAARGIGRGLCIDWSPDHVRHVVAHRIEGSP